MEHFDMELDVLKQKLLTMASHAETAVNEALRALLARLRAEGIHTTLQTNGSIPWKELELIARDVSLFHFDLKGIDPDKHRANTGVGNELALANARRLSEDGYPVVFRIPMVPGYNDSVDDLLGLKSFLDGIGARFADVLPYHNLVERKLELTGISGGRLSLESMSRADAEEKARALEGEGRIVTVGGESIRERQGSKRKSRAR